MTIVTWDELEQLTLLKIKPSFRVGGDKSVMTKIKTGEGRLQSCVFNTLGVEREYTFNLDGSYKRVVRTDFVPFINDRSERFVRPGEIYQVALKYLEELAPDYKPLPPTIQPIILPRGQHFLVLFYEENNEAYAEYSLQIDGKNAEVVVAEGIF